MKNTLKQFFRKAALSSVAALSLGTGLAEAQGVCVPISAQQLYARQYSNEAAACSRFNSYASRTACTNNALYEYNANVGSHPAPAVLSYCDPRFVAPPVVVQQQQTIDPLAAFIGTILIGGVILHEMDHGNNHRSMEPPRHRPAPPPRAIGAGIIKVTKTGIPVITR